MVLAAKICYFNFYSVLCNAGLTINIKKNGYETEEIGPIQMK